MDESNCNPQIYSKEINSPWYPGTGGCPLIDSDKLPGDGETIAGSIAKSRATPKNLILPNAHIYSEFLPLSF